MKVAMLSMWYGDVGKHIADRLFHLLEKPGVTRWAWSVRPARDATLQALALFASTTGKTNDVSIYVESEQKPDGRLEQLSEAADVLLSAVQDDDDFVLWHESDLFTPSDLVQRLTALNVAVAGGWPLLSHEPSMTLGPTTKKRIYLDEAIFYDTWGYRKNNVRFTNLAPYHDCYSPEPFQLDTVGSVVLVKADYIRRGARMNGKGLVGLCDNIREMGGEVWCDPRVPVVQPVELWVKNVG